MFIVGNVTRHALKGVWTVAHAQGRFIPDALMFQIQVLHLPIGHALSAM